MVASNTLEDGWIFCGNIGWDISKDPRNVVYRFFDSINRIDWARNIILNFHESVNDDQIKRIKKYFKHSAGIFIIKESSCEDHFEFQGYLLFDSEAEQKENTEEFVTIGVEKDEFWGEFRIVGIRLINPKSFNRLRTIYAASGAKVGYNRNTARYGLPCPLKKEWPKH